MMNSCAEVQQDILKQLELALQIGCSAYQPNFPNAAIIHSICYKMELADIEYTQQKRMKIYYRNVNPIY
jgi:hypothetical protein